MVPTPRRARASTAAEAAPGVLVITHEDLATVPADAARRRTVRRRRRTARPPARLTRLRAKHVGKKCPYCLTPIKPHGEMVVCPECGIPHHPECWAENGGCTTWGCRATPHRAPQPVTIPVQHERTVTTGFRILNRTYTTSQPRRSWEEGCATGCLHTFIIIVLLIFGGRLLMATGSPIWIFAVVLGIVGVLRLLIGTWGRGQRTEDH